MTRIATSIRMLFLGLAALGIPFTASATEFTWQDTTGAVHSLQEYHGQPLILHFWATWCPPCRAELPELALWRSSHPDVLIIPISLDENPHAAAQFLKKHKFDLSANRGTNRQAIQLGVRGLPSSFLVNENSEITRRFLGAQAWRNPVFSREILHQLKKEKPETSSILAENNL